MTGHEHTGFEYTLGIILLIISAYPVCKILRKMGHHPLMAIFFLIPIINIVVLYILASGKWPIEYEREALKSENEKLKQEKQNSNNQLHHYSESRGGPPQG